MAAIARLMGVPAAAPERCRLLEIGCSDGGNLIPMAVSLPGARLVGVDLTRSEIERGRALAARLGCAAGPSGEGVTLEVKDLRDLAASDGPFDYVVAHGVYSWVPAPVQDALLERIAALLAPSGVAFVSANTLPGWRVRGRVRRLLLERTAAISGLAAKVAAARALLARIEDDLPGLPAREVAYLQGDVEDAHIAHDLLAEVNEPRSVRELLAHAAGHGLAYLSEADLADAAPALGAGRLAAEEALDAARDRSFRRLLLVREGTPLRASLGAEALAALHVASWREELPEAPEGDPLSRSLREAWPRAVAFQELAAGRSSEGREALAARVLDAVRARAAEVRLSPLDHATVASGSPLASPLARRQALEGARVVNLRHAFVRLSEEERRLLPLVDGTRDAEALASALGLEREETGAALRRLARAGLLLSEGRA